MRFWKRPRHRKADDVAIGVINIRVKAGRFHMEAEAELLGGFQILGDNIDNMHTDVIYERLRPEIVHSLKTIADIINEDNDLLMVIEEENE